MKEELKAIAILTLPVILIIGLMVLVVPPQPREAFAAPGFPLQTGGKVTVTTAGTRVQLTTTIENARSIYIEADEDNTGTIYIGGVTVTNDNYVSRITASQGWGITDDSGNPVINPKTIYIDASSNGQSVQWGFF